jgi:hypothetical protein
MKQKRYGCHLLAIVFTCALFLVACGNSSNSQALPITQGGSENSCIPAITTFAFPVRPENSSSQSVLPTKLPGSPWQVEVQLPTLPDGGLETNWILATHASNQHEEIWVRRQWTVIGKNNNRMTDELWVYSTDIRQWRSVPEQLADNSLIGELFAATNGTLWSHNYISKPGEALFSIYNENTKQFEPENATTGIPDGKIVQDQNGVIWVIPYQDHIYSYNTVTEQIQKYTTLPGPVVYDAALARDGSIYILKGSSYLVTASDEELFHFDPKTAKVERIGVPLDPFPVFLHLLVDHTGRLWLDDRGWMDSNGKWYQLLHSPIFITQNLESGADYRWQTPNIMLESSDGRLWFKSDNGLAWLDPQKGEWCWFTTYPSNIVEDQQHNLWIVADNKLYKDSLDSK